MYVCSAPPSPGTERAQRRGANENQILSLSGAVVVVVLVGCGVAKTVFTHGLLLNAADHFPPPATPPPGLLSRGLRTRREGAP